MGGRAGGEGKLEGGKRLPDAGRTPGDGAEDFNFSALPILEAFLTPVKNYLFLSPLHTVDYLSEHNFDKSPLMFAPSFASAPQDPELQMPGIYSFSATVDLLWINRISP